MVITVWRWESPDTHRGPYTNDLRDAGEAGNALYCALSQHSGYGPNGATAEAAHPVPSRDGLGDHYRHPYDCDTNEYDYDVLYVSATATEAKLDEWFADVPDELLLDAGYVKTELTVPLTAVEYGHSGKQVTVDAKRVISRRIVRRSVSV